MLRSKSALLSDSQGVGHGLRALGEESLHLGLGRQMVVVVWPEMRQRLVDCRIEPGRHQRILEAGPPRMVVVNIVGCHHRYAGFAGKADQIPVARGIALQKVVVKLDVHRVRAVPLGVTFQQSACIAAATVHSQSRELPIASTSEQDDMPSEWSDRWDGSSLGSLRSTALARVNSLEILE